MPSYLVTRVLPFNSVLVEKETLLPSTLPSIISHSGSFAAAAAQTRDAAGQLGAVLLQGDGYRTARISAAARLFIGPLAGHIRRQNGECESKRNRNYKKQLFGHSAGIGVML